MTEISAERTYYVRTSLMYTDMAREVLFKVFRFLIDTEDIAGFLSSPDQQNKLYELRQQNILNEADYNLVSGHFLNPERFDISLLIRLISNLCKDDKIQQPKLVRKSKPQPKDESLGADLYRLRDVRNKIIGHRSDASLSESEYEHTWTKVKAILLRVIQHVDAENSEDFEQRLDKYKLLNIDTEDSRVKKLMAELLEYQRETESLQEKVEELSSRSNELQVYFKTTPERYVRYIKLLFEGGRIVLCGILERVLGDRTLSDLLVHHRTTLEEYIDEVFFSFLFPEEPTTVDHRTWDIYLLALVLLLVFKDDLNDNEIRDVELINAARIGYAENALNSVDTDSFLTMWTDLINSLNHLSIYIPEDNRQQVEHLIEVYKKRDEAGGNAEEYFEKLRESGVEVKTLKDVYKETVARLRNLLRQLNEKGVKFKQEHVLEMKMLTTCENEEIKRKAEDLLEVNIQASLRGLPHRCDPIRIETDKLVANIAAHPGVKPGEVIRKCIIWSFTSSTPCDFLHILDYCESDQYRYTLQNIASELNYMYGYVFVLQGHFTLESLSSHPMLTGNTDEAPVEQISIPLKCSLVDGIRSVLSELKQERTTNNLNKIAEQISAEVRGTVSIKVFPAIMEFQDVLDDTGNQVDSDHAERENVESSDKLAYEHEDNEAYKKLSHGHEEIKTTNTRKQFEDKVENEIICDSGATKMSIETNTSIFPSFDVGKEPTIDEVELGRQNLQKYNLSTPTFEKEETLSFFWDINETAMMQENESLAKYIPEDTKKTDWNYDTKEMLTTKEIDEKDEGNVEKYEFSTESEGSSSFGRNEEDDEVLVSDEMDQRHHNSSSSYELDSDHEERENVESSDKLAYEHEDNEAYKKLSHNYWEIKTTNTRKQFEDKVENEIICDSGATKMSMETNTSIVPSIDIGKEHTIDELELGRQNLQKHNLDDTVVIQEDDSRAKDVSEDIKKTDCDTEKRLAIKKIIDEKEKKKYDFNTDFIYPYEEETDF